MKRSGNQAVVEQLIADGVQYVFGNPGTVEQGLIEQLAASPVDYILGLHEGAVVAAADGYARASKGLGVAQLHSSVGLGNGIGTLYQAHRGGSPLLVLVGEAGVAYDALGAQMAADLTAMAAPVTKATYRVLHSDSVLRVLRRAVAAALTPPQGPVVVVLPADVLDAPNTEPVLPTAVPVTRVAPDSSVLRQAAELLQTNGRRIVLMGDGVAQSGGQAELTAVAELLGAEVYGVNESEVNFDTSHPNYRGQTGHMFGATSSGMVQDATSVLVVGTYLFPEVYASLQSPFAESTRIVQIDLDAGQIAKNHPVDLGIVADPALTLGRLAEELRSSARTPNPVHAPGARELPAPLSDSPLEHLARELATQAGELLLFDEALTSSPTVTRYLPPRRLDSFFQTRGGSLGIGIPGAVGASLARPTEQVITFTGDGASMYTPQALWTAARYGIPAKFVICNNGRYQLLDDNIEQYWATAGRPAGPHPDAFALSPAIDFAALARSLGVEALTLTDAKEAASVAAHMLAHDGPVLVNATV